MPKEEEALPTFKMATDYQHDRFRHILLLLCLVTAYNYNKSMLPDEDYVNQIDLVVDKEYRRFSCPGVLNSLVTVFVRDNEVIVTAELPHVSSIVLTTVASDMAPMPGNIRKVAVIKNGVIDETSMDLEEAAEPISLG